MQLEDEHNNTLYIELSTDNSYWKVNSGGVFRKGYGDNKEEVWSASEEQNEQSATDNTLRATDKSDNPVTPNGNVSKSSESKVTEKSGNGQGKADENSQNSVGAEEPDVAAAEPQPVEKGYTIERTTYTNKKGKTSDVWLVKFDGELTKEQVSAGMGRVFELADELREARERLEDYEGKMKEELEAKEAKYAEMDAGVEEAANVRLVDEDEESEENLQFSDGEDVEGVAEDADNEAARRELEGYDAGRMTFEDAVTDGLTKLAAKNKEENYPSLASKIFN